METEASQVETVTMAQAWEQVKDYFEKMYCQKQTRISPIDMLD
jgi:hypothetical protein